MSPCVLTAGVINRYTTVARLSYCMDVCIQYLHKGKKAKKLAYTLWNFPVVVHAYFRVTFLDMPYFTRGAFRHSFYQCCGSGSEYVPGPPGSGSISQSYGSGSFYHQAKIEKPWFLLLCDFFLNFFSIENYVITPSKTDQQKNLFLN